VYSRPNVSVLSNADFHDYCSRLLDRPGALLVVGREARLELRGAAGAGGLLVVAGVALYLTCAFWASRYEAKELRPLSILQQSWLWKDRIALCGIPCIGAWHA